MHRNSEDKSSNLDKVIVNKLYFKILKTKYLCYFNFLFCIYFPFNSSGA